MPLAFIVWFYSSALSVSSVGALSSFSSSATSMGVSSAFCISSSAAASSLWVTRRVEEGIPHLRLRLPKVKVPSGSTTVSSASQPLKMPRLSDKRVFAKRTVCKFRQSLNASLSRFFNDAGKLIYNSQFVGTEGKTYGDYLNPDSKILLSGCKLEMSLKDAKVGDRFQFVRNGYFCKDSKYDNTFNSIVPLKDSKGK